MLSNKINLVFFTPATFWFLRLAVILNEILIVFSEIKLKIGQNSIQSKLKVFGDDIFRSVESHQGESKVQWIMKYLSVNVIIAVVVVVASAPEIEISSAELSRRVSRNLVSC